MEKPKVENSMDSVPRISKIPKIRSQISSSAQKPNWPFQAKPRSNEIQSHPITSLTNSSQNSVAPFKVSSLFCLTEQK